MDEQTRLLEMVVGQIDKRLGSIEQHLAGFHAAIEHVREEVVQVRTDLHAEIVGVRTELKGEMAGLRTELRDEMAGLRTVLKGEMAQLGTDLRNEMRQIRGELEAIRTEGRSHLRWSLTGMFTLFGAATPLWMWLLSRIIK